MRRDRVGSDPERARARHAERAPFYREVLGFDVERGGPEDSNCALKHGDSRLMLETAADHYGDAYNAAIRERLGSPSSHALYIEADDLQALHGRIEAGGARVVDPLADRPWGSASSRSRTPRATG